MTTDDRGAQVLARLVAGAPSGPRDLDGLAEPWYSLCRSVLRADSHAARVATLKAAVADLPDRAAIVTAVFAAVRAVARQTEDTDDLVLLADVPARPVRWLWPGRLPLGKLTVLDGDPGLGKSALTLDIAARVSAGRPMPDGAPPDPAGPRGAVLLSAEDSLADTIRPRLAAAGADLARVTALTSVVDRPLRRGDSAIDRWTPRLPTLADLAAIRRAIAAVEAALVVVDPIMAYLPRGVDSGRDAHVRSLLAHLAGLAESEDVAVLVVRHLTKSGRGNPLYRGGGSVGIIGAARSGLLVARDPDDPTGARRVLASTKANLAGATIALTYQLTSADNGTLRVVWEGPSEHTATSLLDASTVHTRDEPTALDEARDVLRSILADGPKPATAAQAEARAAGVSPGTLRRAREALGIRPRKDGFRGGCWTWQSPAGPAESQLPDRQPSVAPTPPGPSDTARDRPTGAQPSPEAEQHPDRDPEDAHAQIDAHIAHLRVPGASSGAASPIADV